MKTILLLSLIFFTFSCCEKKEDHRETLKYEMTAVVTYMDYNVDTVSTVVYSNGVPYFSLNLYGESPYLAVYVNINGLGYSQNYKILAYNVRSFKEIYKP